MLSPAPQGQDRRTRGVGPNWPGAVITTSTRADVYRPPPGTRYRRGPVHVFNPAGVGDVPSTFGWDVVAGCQDPAEAFARADSLIGPRVGGKGDMAFWQDKAAIALAALLHAAALTPGADVLDIWAWCNRQGDAIAGSALAHHPAASAVLRAVFAEIQREGRSPDSVRLTMAKSLAWVAVPSVARPWSPGRWPGRSTRPGSPWRAERCTSSHPQGRARPSRRCSGASWTTPTGPPRWPGPASRPASWTRPSCWPWTRSSRWYRSRWTSGSPTRR